MNLRFSFNRYLVIIFLLNTLAILLYAPFIGFVGATSVGQDFSTHKILFFLLPFLIVLLTLPIGIVMLKMGKNGFSIIFGGCPAITYVIIFYLYALITL